ncbi:unnamed protein product, partial [Allacma fusca]
EVEEALDWP